MTEHLHSADCRIFDPQAEIAALRDRIDAIEARLPRVGPATRPQPEDVEGLGHHVGQADVTPVASAGISDYWSRLPKWNPDWKPLGDAPPWDPSAPDKLDRPKAPKALATGRIVDLMAIEPADIDFALAADALSKIARFDGNTRGEFAYSVAQHSVLVAENCPRGPERTVGLLHDLHEWLIGDITRPVQGLIGDLAGYHKACEAIDRAVAEAAGIAWDDWQRVRAEVKYIDDRVLVTEARLLMDTFDAAHWPDERPLLSVFGITPLRPREARKQFVQTLLDLTGIDARWRAG